MQCFTVNNDEVRGNRIDPYYYSPSNICDIAKKTIFEVLELSEITKLQRGKFSHRPRNDPKFFNGLYPFIQTGDIVKSSQNNLPIGYSQTLNDLGLSVSKLFIEQTILITIAANIGDTAILNYPACFPDSVVAITPKKEVIKLEYLNIYLKFLKNYLNNLAPQAAQKNINLEQLSPTPIVIPPIKIQEQIIAIMDKAYNSKKEMEYEAEGLLSGIDDYVLGELGIKIAEIEEKKCFTVYSEELKDNRIDPHYYGENFKKLTNGLHSSKYDLVTFKDCADFLPGYAFNSKSYVDNSFLALLTIKNITNNGIDFEKITFLPDNFFTKYHQFKIIKGDLIFAMTGATIGKCCLYNSDQEALLNQRVGIIRAKENSSNLFLNIILNFELYQKLIVRESVGGAQPNISEDAIMSLTIPLPPLKTQNKISSEVKARTEKAEKLKEEAKSLLQKAKDEVEKMILGGE
jgi:restriction endonuclease S subunit